MSEIIKLILSLSLSGTALIILLLLFRPLYRSRLSKKWQYYIWLVVIWRLLLPITLQTSLTGNLILTAEQILPGITTSAPLPQDTGSSSPGNISNVKSDSGQSGRIQNGQQPAAPLPDADAAAMADAENAIDRPVSAGTLVFALWLITALLLLMRKITIYQSFRKYIDAGCIPLNDMQLLECFGRIIEENHIKSSLDLYTNSLVSSPLLIGLFRPRIILPDTNLSERDFYYTVLHELVHYRRRDMLYKWLMQFTLCVHWFNPFVYLMKNEVNQLCELSCDERVVELIPENARISYGDTLLNAAAVGGSYKDTLASVTLHESKELLKRRLDAIMNYKKFTKTIQFITLFVTGILVGGAIVLGAYAAPGSHSDSSADSSTQPDIPTGSAIGQANSVHNGSDGSADAVPLHDYRIEREDTIYYIYVDGADETDRPLSMVTNGFYKLVFVYEDRYSTFGSFREKDMSGLVRYIGEQCRTMVGNGTITQADADFYLLAAGDIQDTFLTEEEFSENEVPEEEVPETDHHFNVQCFFYQQPYLIGLCYSNSPDRLQTDAYSRTQIVLSDESTVQVYSAPEYIPLLEDPETQNAVTAASSRMLVRVDPESVYTASIIVTDIEYAGNDNFPALAEKYWETQKLPQFSAIFRELDSQTQTQYLEQMFAERNVSFFACCIGELEDNGKQEEAVERYALKAYQEDVISFFAVLIGMMDAESKVEWLEKCREDNATNYLHLFGDSADFEDFDSFDNYDDFDDFNKFDDFDNFDKFDDFDDFGDFDNFDDFNDFGDFDKFDDFDNWDDYYLNDYPDGRGFPDEYNENNISKPAVVDLNRVTQSEVSDKIRNALSACEDGKWYVIESDGCQYIYYNGLPHTYAYEPQFTDSEKGSLITVSIVDIKSDSPHLQRIEAANHYVLLAFSCTSADPDTEYNLTIQYNQIPVTYTRKGSRSIIKSDD
ncbi:MAG: M56 family metallopeptidase [Lachnospiraceae bacterium]|nr:M56 family metallopeptidase [Lachnospiraceae bacterium]